MKSLKLELDDKHNILQILHNVIIFTLIIIFTCFINHLYFFLLKKKSRDNWQKSVLVK